MRIALAVLLALLCASCATPNDMGLRAYNVGKYEAAYDRWVPAAAAGDPSANYNMGLLWQAGLSTRTPTDPDKAAEFFLKAANAGLPLAMGPVADYQLSKNNPDTALIWLNLGARWNDPGSIERLRKLGAPVPAPDLAIAQQQQIAAQQQVQAQNAYVLSYALACAAAGGCASPAPRSPVAQNPAPASPIRCRAEAMRDVAGNLIYRCK